MHLGHPHPVPIVICLAPLLPDATPPEKQAMFTPYRSRKFMLSHSNPVPKKTYQTAFDLPVAAMHWPTQQQAPLHAKPSIPFGSRRILDDRAMQRNWNAKRAPGAKNVAQVPKEQSPCMAAAAASPSCQAKHSGQSCGSGEIHDEHEMQHHLNAMHVLGTKNVAYLLKQSVPLPEHGSCSRLPIMLSQAIPTKLWQRRNT